MGYARVEQMDIQLQEYSNVCRGHAS